MSEIVTSIGNYGLDAERSFDRLYWNRKEGIANPYALESGFNRLWQQAEMRGRTRAVFRGIVSNEIMQHITRNNSRLQPYIEVALPVGNQETPDWLLGLGRNTQERQSIEPVDFMISQTSESNPRNHSLAQIIEKVTNNGYTFVNRIEADNVDDLTKLWGETFGWDRRGIEQRAEDIEQDQRNSSRSVWFSGIQDHGRLVSAAMAERLVLTHPNGEELSLVESTEWRTADNLQGKGLLTAVVSHLNAQIYQSAYNQQEAYSLVFAECNFQSHSDRAALKAGFTIPNRQVGGMIVPQILIQNVLVNDGHRYEDKLRDFTFMSVSNNTVETMYSPEDVSSALKMVS